MSGIPQLPVQSTLESWASPPSWRFGQLAPVWGQFGIEGLKVASLSIIKQREQFGAKFCWNLCRLWCFPFSCQLSYEAHMPKACMRTICKWVYTSHLHWILVCLNHSYYSIMYKLYVHVLSSSTPNIHCAWYHIPNTITSWAHILISSQLTFQDTDAPFPSATQAFVLPGSSQHTTTHPFRLDTHTYT